MAVSLRLVGLSTDNRIRFNVLAHQNPQPNESISLGKSKTNLLGASSGDEDSKDEAKTDKDEQPLKKLPIINPLVRLPSWPK